MKRITIDIPEDANLISVMSLLGESVHSALAGEYVVKDRPGGKVIASVTIAQHLPFDMEFTRQCGILCVLEAEA